MLQTFGYNTQEQQMHYSAENCTRQSEGIWAESLINFQKFT